MLDLAPIEIDCKFARLHASEIMRFYACENPLSKENYRMVNDKKCAACKARKSKHNLSKGPTEPDENQMSFDDWLTDD